MKVSGTTKNVSVIYIPVEGDLGAIGKVVLRGTRIAIPQSLRLLSTSYCARGTCWNSCYETETEDQSMVVQYRQRRWTVCKVVSWMSISWTSNPTGAFDAYLAAARQMTGLILGSSGTDANRGVCACCHWLLFLVLWTGNLDVSYSIPDYLTPWKDIRCSWPASNHSSHCHRSLPCLVIVWSEDSHNDACLAQNYDKWLWVTRLWLGI